MYAKIKWSFVLFIVIFTSCKPKLTALEAYTSSSIEIQPINENIFVHISYLDAGEFGLVGCNGMVYVNGNEAVIYDSPTTNEASLELIQWLGARNIKAIIPTHFHTDCLGGLQAFHNAGIKSFAHHKTITLAKKQNKVIPQNGFDDVMEIQVGDELAMVKFMGEGHTRDNTIGYIPSEHTLFGGCLVKERNAEKGNLEDANVSAWPLTVARIKTEFPDLKTVVPGHGIKGGTEQLDYTIRLFAEN